MSIKSVFGSKSILGKALDFPGSLLQTGYDKVKTDVLGVDKDQDPIQKFLQIFNSSELNSKPSLF